MQTIETPRLLIRIDTYEDYVEAYRTLDDASLKQRFGVQTDADLHINQVKVSGGLTTYRSSVRFFHLILKEEQVVVGSVSFHNWFPQDKRSEIGYDIRTERHKNKGYMKEAMPSLVAYGFETMELNRLEAFIHPDNIPSRRLVEAVGFEQEGLLKGRYRRDGVFSDAVVYALMADQYRSAH